MDGELWEPLYRFIDAVDNGVHVQKPSMKFRDATIVRVYYWSVLHDRPTCWACDGRNWRGCPTDLLPSNRDPAPDRAPDPAPDRDPDGSSNLNLPSQPTMSRRLRHDPGVQQFLDELARAVGDSFRIAGMLLVLLLDGKPLPVGRHSKDPDARWGRGAGGQDKGYKLHTLWTGSPIPLWQVRPMNAAEPTVALRLVEQLQPGSPGAYVLADKAYDSNPLHAQAAAVGRQLVAPPRVPLDRAGRGHRPQHPARLHALDMLRRPMGQDLMRLRVEVERDLGNLTSFGGGLGPLNAWVRRQHRVQRWTGAKLVINALRIRRVHERHAA